MVEMSGVEKSGIENSGVEMSSTNFEAFSTIEIHRFCGLELSSIEQTAPADPNF